MQTSQVEHCWAIAEPWYWVPQKLDLKLAAQFAISWTISVAENELAVGKDKVITYLESIPIYAFRRPPGLSK